MEEEYYFIFKSWSLDSNQWSILIGSIGFLLTLIGFAIAFKIYKNQRKDSAQDAYVFFQLSLPDLNNAILSTIQNLENFIKNLENDNFSNPILSASLNDKFINKINIVDLVRYYNQEKKQKIQNLKDLLIDANFFGDYHSYFTNEINFFRNNYLEKEAQYSKWQLLRTNKFFSSMADQNEEDSYKRFYANWTKNLNKDSEVFELNEKGEAIKMINRPLLIKKHLIPLAKEIVPFIQFSEKANEINLISNQIIAAYDDIEEMKISIEKVFKNDIIKFKEINNLLDKIIEQDDA
ncbi:hypothetical protein [Gramella sp. AN32]|uniref:Uncharacterized protein n=1 Tax=Christiangramia antarctica TaxID=2058158 RepID=A0ABW5XBN5_9FLAO|nr:hypothetical protein [Gramella sp. AN32]MCM4158232.1 hypothetical protein [Gramella sp. AN32]